MQQYESRSQDLQPILSNDKEKSWPVGGRSNGQMALVLFPSRKFDAWLSILLLQGRLDHTDD